MSIEEDILDKQDYVSQSSLHYLLQELVPTSIRISEKLINTTTTTIDTREFQTRIDTQLSSIHNDLPGTINVLNSNLINSDDVSIRIESFGYQLGIKLSEILLFKNNQSKIIDILDIMKFVCRDVWKSLYNKQMDNLRTNHRGTFVLVDSNYRVISHLNSSKGMKDTLMKSRIYLWFPCGIIKGILLKKYITVMPQPPSILRIKRKRNQDPLQALILEDKQSIKRSKPSTPLTTPTKSRSIENFNNYVFKLQRTDDKVNIQDESIINSILKESNGNNFIIPKNQIEQDTTIPHELSDMVQSYLSFDKNSPPRRKRSSRKSFSEDKKQPILDDYVYDVYIMDTNEPLTSANHPSSQIGYIKFFDETSNELINNDDDEKDDERVLTDDEDSNAESFYQNDYPSDEDAGGLEDPVEFEGETEDDGYVPYDGTGLKGDEYYDYGELENYEEDDYFEDDNYNRNQFFDTDKDDPIAIHRDKIFNKLKNMINEDE
ncbi:unnamed protein product [Candida verbasci]|uniref:Transcription factor Iwr1 domain-containing protein n=1 Tax=Candida verbasci TaxID=1227364 RepID=A0A9W4XC35_9ASCO|nr:unnamed protein product [Candida verbasci]